jgi:hypothetical protein
MPLPWPAPIDAVCVSTENSSVQFGSKGLKGFPLPYRPRTTRVGEMLCPDPKRLILGPGAESCN